MPAQPVWGMGGPVLVDRAPTAMLNEVVVGLFDIHYDKHEVRLLEAAFKVIEEIQPDRIVFGGDYGDEALLSRWQQHIRDGMPQGKVARIVHAESERMSRELFGRVRDIVGPDVKIDAIEGNHDERKRRWLDDDPAESIREYGKLMQFDRYGVDWHPRSGFLLRPEFLIRHGNYTVMHTAKKEYDTTKCGGWSGHKHTTTLWDETLHETYRRYQWIVAPTMSRVDYDYGPGQSGKAPWPQGFLVGTFSTLDQYDYHTETAQYWRGKLRFRGKTY